MLSQKARWGGGATGSSFLKFCLVVRHQLVWESPHRSHQSVCLLVHVRQLLAWLMLKVGGGDEESSPTASSMPVPSSLLISSEVQCLVPSRYVRNFTESNGGWLLVLMSRHLMSRQGRHLKLLFKESVKALDRSWKAPKCPASSLFQDPKACRGQGSGSLGQLPNLHSFWRLRPFLHPSRFSRGTIC